MKSITTFSLSIFIFFGLHAQNFSDALRYSQTLESGTARSVAVGNGIGALGGDFAALSINPAGVATFRKSEFTFSPSLFYGNGESTLNGSTAESNSLGTKFFLENAGLVIARRPRSNTIMTSNFGIGINRIADFNETIQFSGSSTGTITDRWLVLADDIDPDNLDDFEAGPAFVSGAIFDLGDDLFYESDFISSDIVSKNQIVERTGGINEFVFDWGMNIKNKFSVGVGLGFPVVNFEEDKTYNESDPGDLIPFFKDLRFDESLSVSGRGMNLKVGVILHSIKNVRIGLAWESPTRYRMEERFSTAVGYEYIDDEETFVALEESPDGTFEYRLKTPQNARLDFSYLIRSDKFNAFFSAGAYYTDFSKNSFDFTAFSNDPAEVGNTDDANAGIDNELQSTLSYNAGAELAVKHFRVRGGIILQQSPFAIDDGKMDNILSAGLGFRHNKFFLDMAIRRSSAEEGYIPFAAPDFSTEQVVTVDKTINKLIVTAGFKF